MRAFGLDSALVMSRESDEISEESKSKDLGEVVSSASNDHLDNTGVKSSRLIVDLSEIAEKEAFIDQETEKHLFEVRSRKLTERGQSYQTEIKVKSFKSKRSIFTGTLRKTLLLRGQCNELPTWKQEFSKAQVLWNEFTDAYHEISEIVQDEELANVKDIWEQVCGEWSNFERDVRDEIKYLEQTVLESGSVSSKGSKKSKLAKSVKSKSSVDTVCSTKVDKYKLQQEEAALKVKLAYMEQEKALELERLMQEQKLEELKLKKELELSRAKLSVCEGIEREQTPSIEEDLANLTAFLFLDDRTLLARTVGALREAQAVWAEFSRLTRAKTHEGKSQVWARTEAAFAAFEAHGWSPRFQVEVLGVSVGLCGRGISPSETLRFQKAHRLARRLAVLPCSHSFKSSLVSLVLSPLVSWGVAVGWACPLCC